MSNRPPLIYLAAPYSHPDQNVRKLRVHCTKTAAAEMVKAGHVVFAPTVYTDELDHYEPPQGWYEFDLAILSRCDELVILPLEGWEDSKGIKMEIALARTMGISVTFMHGFSPVTIVQKFFDKLDESINKILENENTPDIAEREVGTR